MAKRLVLIGECMVELAAGGAADTYRMSFAGDTFNTAWYVRRGLGADWAVEYVTAVGRDELSDRMLAFIEASGVGTSHVQRMADRTVGLYMISLNDGERSFSYWRGQSAARRMAADPAALEAAFAGAEVLYLSGITLAVLEGEGRETLLAALARARGQGARVVFDPNLRPRLWNSTGAMCDAVMAAASVSDIVLPSHEDEASYFGDADPAATAERYRAAGAALVVVKNGADPMLARDGRESITVAPERVAEVVDTTAAGDSFNAGFLSAHLRGAGLEEAVRRGAALAARVVQAHGALVDTDV
jgi:2-dehydro-3-deoxygluconokinase